MQLLLITSWSIFFKIVFIILFIAGILVLFCFPKDKTLGTHRENINSLPNPGQIDDDYEYFSDNIQQ